MGGSNMAKEDKRDGGVTGGMVKRLVWLSERVWGGWRVS